MKALITGINGQVGSYLAELLLENGYDVHGTIRRNSTPNTHRIDHILDKITLHGADLTDYGSMLRLISDVEPDEVYNLAAQSYVHESWNSPVSTGDITALGVTRLLDAIARTNKDIKFYQASSSEMFGNASQCPQNEQTPFSPRSPYGVAKLYGHWIAVNYRESYNMFCVSGILFNNESPRRGLEFVTRKISHAVAEIKCGVRDRLALGNLNACRDWGYTGDYVRAIWLMMQHDTPDSFVIATGETHSIKDFLEAAFGYVSLDWRDYVETDNKLYRPAEINVLCGDASKAKHELGWEPSTKFDELVSMMVQSDIERIEKCVS